MAAASARVQRERKPRWGPVSKSQEPLYPDHALVKCILPSIEPDRVGAVAPADQLAARPSRQGPRSRTGSLDAGGRSAWPRKTHRERRQPSAFFPASGTWSRGRGQPTITSIRPLFLPDLVQQAARNKQIDAQIARPGPPRLREMGARPQGRRLAAVERDAGRARFQPRLAARPGYTTQSDVTTGQPWTLTPKWPVPGSGEVDAALGKFRFDETGKLTGEPLVMVELKGAKIDLDRKMPTRNITPVQQVWNYLNASDSAQWAIVCNYAEIRLYSRQKSSNHLHRVFLTELDDPVKFAEFYAIFHADSLLATVNRWAAEVGISVFD